MKTSDVDGEQNATDSRRFPTRSLRQRAGLAASLISLGLAVAEAELADLPWRSTILICQWQSPTDFLLKDADDPFWKADSSFSDPIINPARRSRARPN